MELDELKSAWSEQSRRLDTVVRLNQRLVRDALLTKVRRPLHRLVFALSLELAVLAIVLVWMGHFWGTRLTELRFALPGILLHMSAIGLAGVRAHQIVGIANIDYGAPILDIQRRVERVRLDRIRLAKWVTLLVLPLGTPVMLVGAEGLLGIDLWEAFGATWVWANFAFGVAASLVMVWIARHYGDRLQRRPFVEGLVRDVSGHSLSAAMANLAELEDFERE